MTVKKIVKFEPPSLEEFNCAVDSTLPGWCIIYHIGNLAKDRLERPRVDAIASYVNSRAMRGHVSLVQRRLGAHVIEYMAVKAKEPRPLPANLWDGIPRKNERARTRKLRRGQQ